MPISDYLKGIRAAIGHDMLLSPGVAAIIRDEAGRVLLQKRSDDGLWSLPAGAIDPGETPAQAVVREAHEETGLHVVPEKVAGVFGGVGFRHTYPHGDKIEIVSIVFLCKVTGGELDGLDGESLELRYVTPEDFPESPILNRYPKELFRMKQEDEPLF